ncbi:MAG: enoyl-CoA hydratase-related protein [Aquabacterium sp.]
MSTELLTQTHGKTLVMTLSGPGNRNALSPQVHAAGIEALNMAESNPDIGAVVITGAGEHFCSGGDLQRLRQQRAHDLAGQAAVLRSFHDWVLALRAFPKPVLAAVEGHASGAGVSLALACDAVCAASDAHFHLSHIRAGLSPDGGLSMHLVRALGRQRAWMAMALGDTHTAADWLAWGLVHSLSEPGQALSRALAVAEQLSAQAPGAIAAMKELCNSADNRLAEHLNDELRQFMVTLAQPEAGTAIEAFFQRQPA